MSEEFDVYIDPIACLGRAIQWLDKCNEGLERAPKNVRVSLDCVKERVEDFKEGLRDELFREIFDDGDWCQDCPYLKVYVDMVPYGDTSVPMPSGECKGTPANCPGVLDILGGE